MEYYKTQDTTHTLSYVYGPTGVIAAYYDDSGPYYYLTDHLGSTRMVLGVDSTVTVLADFFYMPSGDHPNQIDWVENVETPVKFTGKELDDEGIFGLYYFGARYYDPFICRWISPDPILTSTTPYGYVNGNLMNMVDPNGEFPWLAAIMYAYQAYSVGKSVYDAYQEGGIAAAIPTFTTSMISNLAGDMAGTFIGDQFKAANREMDIRVFPESPGSWPKTFPISRSEYSLSFNLSMSTLPPAGQSATSAGMNAILAKRNARGVLSSFSKGAIPGAAAGFLSSKPFTNIFRGKGFRTDWGYSEHIGATMTGKIHGPNSYAKDISAIPAGLSEDSYYPDNYNCTAFALDIYANNLYNDYELYIWGTQDNPAHWGMLLGQIDGISYYLSKIGSSGPIMVAPESFLNECYRTTPINVSWEILQDLW